MPSLLKVWERFKAFTRNERPRQTSATRGRIWEKKSVPAPKGKGNTRVRGVATLDIKIIRADGTILEYKDLPASAVEVTENG